MFESNNHCFCREKNNYPTNETEKALCTERHFPIETVFFKKNISQKIPKISEILLSKSLAHKKTTKKRPPPGASCAFSALLRYFLSLTENEKCTKK